MTFLWLASVLSLSLLSIASAAGAKNILMIVVDDLRPQIKAYGVPWMVTPHIDKLASQGEPANAKTRLLLPPLIAARAESPPPPPPPPQKQ